MDKTRIFEAWDRLLGLGGGGLYEIFIVILLYDNKLCGMGLRGKVFFGMKDLSFLQDFFPRGIFWFWVTRTILYRQGK